MLSFITTSTELWAENICSLEAFQIWFGVLLGFAMLRSLKPLCEFYEWFASSGLKMAEKRGYGQKACKFYGFIPSPNLSPSVMRRCGVVFTMLIILAALGNLALLLNLELFQTSRLAITITRTLIGSFQILAIGFYHLFFSQLYCEAAVGAHVTVLIPPTLLILAMFNFHAATMFRDPFHSPVDLNNPADYKTFTAEVFFTLLIKLIMFLAYGRAGLSKIFESFKHGRNWCNGSSLQGSMFEALWSADEGWGSRAEEERRKAVDKLQHQKNSSIGVDSNGGNLGLGSAGPHLPHYSFGLPTPYSHMIQRFLFRSPRILCISSYLAVLVEAAAPLTLLAHIVPEMVSPWLTLGFGITGFGLHAGILYLQNVDFLSWWLPCYVFFFDPLIRIHSHLGGVVERPTMIRALNSAYPSLIWSSAPAMVAVVYTFVHLSVCGILGGSQDIGMCPNKLSAYTASMLPLSPFRMFCDIKDLFSPKVGKTIWLSDKPHATGTLKNYAFPFAAKEHVEEDELCQLPFKYLVIRYGGTAAPPAPEKVQPLLQTNQKPVNVWTNLVWTADLEARLADLERIGRLGEGKWADVQCLDELLDSVTQLRQAFNAAERTQPSTEAHSGLAKEAACSLA